MLIFWNLRVCHVGSVHHRSALCSCLIRKITLICLTRIFNITPLSASYSVYFKNFWPFLCIHKIIFVQNIYFFKFLNEEKTDFVKSIWDLEMYHHVCVITRNLYDYCVIVFQISGVDYISILKYILVHTCDLYSCA